MADQNIEKGDQVSWQWSGGRPSGEVAEVVKEGEATVTSNKGNEIKKNADPEDPAVHISRPGNDVVKRAHELDVEEKASGAADGGEKAATQEKRDEDSEMKDAHEGEKNGEAKTGEKRDHAEAEDEKAENPIENGAKVHKENGEKNSDNAGEDDDDNTQSEEKDDEPPAKKQKTNEADDAAEEKNGGEPAKKGRGRPKKNEANGEKKAATKKRGPKKAATESGEPRRSSRHKA